MITIDFETKSYADLPKVGTWAYSEDPTTEVICVAYGVDSKPIQTWWPGKKLEGAQAWSKILVLLKDLSNWKSQIKCHRT